GFVFSMIFAHAPIILPAVSGRAVAYSPVFYSNLALLHASLVVRIAGDLLALPAVRGWGGSLQRDRHRPVPSEYHSGSAAWQEGNGRGVNGDNGIRSCA